jgi:hypothetical protein
MVDFLILAAKSVAATAPTGKGMSVEWAIVGAGVIIGVALTLLPAKRTSEIKKRKDN